MPQLTVEVVGLEAAVATIALVAQAILQLPLHRRETMEEMGTIMHLDLALAVVAGLRR